jgi:hypothetical protein
MNRAMKLPRNKELVLVTQRWERGEYFERPLRPYLSVGPVDNRDRPNGLCMTAFDRSLIVAVVAR